MVKINQWSLTQAMSCLRYRYPGVKRSVIAERLARTVNSASQHGVTFDEVRVGYVDASAISRGRMSGFDVCIRISSLIRPELIIIDVFPVRPGGEVGKVLLKLKSSYGRMSLVENNSLDFLLDEEKVWYTNPK